MLRRGTMPPLLSDLKASLLEPRSAQSRICFIADDRTGAEALRDAYATANPTWLAEYNADESLAIELIYNA